MRDLKFRGMGIKGNWYFGNLSILKKDIDHIKSGYYISNSVGLPFAYEIRPETIGQFTGLKDKNGKEIYDGDIVREEFNHGIKNCEIIYELGGYFIKNEKEEIKDNLHWHIKGIEVIGNIFENPKLINHPLTQSREE